MGNPAKVVNFFDLAGSWDPSLAFVMGGAVVVTFIGYRLVLKREQPLFAGKFGMPTRSDIDARLVGGSLLFGVGWGIAGFCPGGALPVLGTGNLTVVLFVAALIVGMFLARIMLNRGPEPKPKDSPISGTANT
jgi:uncharacterized membrane protein YedE/YeeE